MQKQIWKSVKGVFDRRKLTDHGPVEFETKKAEHASEVLAIGSNKPVTVTKTATIKLATKLMAQNSIRRLPVIDPGTKRLLGIFTARDVLDFLGGGEKANLAENIPKGINTPIGKIMEEKVLTLSETASVADAVSFFKKNKIRGAPILNKNDRVTGFLTERDLLKTGSGALIGKSVRDYMAKNPITASLGMSIHDTARAMLKNDYRRLPVVQEDELRGMVTAMDIIRAIDSSKIFEKDLTISKIMTSKVVTTQPDAQLSELARLASQKRIGAFPVLENKNLRGIITEHDILRAMM